MSYYPVLLDLAERPVAVVGGGAVALEKVEGLLAAGAAVTVYADRLEPELARLRDRGRVAVREREPTEAEVGAAFLVLAERRDRPTNERVFAAAEATGRFVNVQDDVPCSSFIAPAIVRQGDLVVSISTSGAAPALAVRLRQLLSRQLGPEYASFLALARRFRRPLAKNVPSFAERRRRWYRLVDSEVWARLRGDDQYGAERLASQILGVTPDA